VAVVNGLGNAHTLLREIKEKKRNYHFIEVMCCPGGCLGGGGQPYPQGDCEALATAVYTQRAEGLYAIDERKTIRRSHCNPDITRIYAEFLEKPLGHLSHKLLHTHYHKRLPQGVATEMNTSVNLFK